MDLYLLRNIPCSSLLAISIDLLYLADWFGCREALEAHEEIRL